MAFSPRARVLLLVFIIFAALSAFVWWLSVKYRTTPVTPIAPPTATETTEARQTTNDDDNNNNPTSPTASPSVNDGAAPTPSVSPRPSTSPLNSSPAPMSAPTSANSSSNASPNSNSTQLLIPVEGVRADQLQDTFTAARSAGRTHDAIDIIAPHNTPVLAAADGNIVKLFQSVPGGTTIYQLGTDQKTVYYYAHLDHYADGLVEGHFARRGETIGYVGDTGNAGAGNYHLHFSVSIVSDPKRYWDGTNINPYPLLTNK